MWNVRLWLVAGRWLVLRVLLRRIVWRRLGNGWWMRGLVGLLWTLVLLLVPVGLVTAIAVVRVQSRLLSGRTRLLGWLGGIPLRVISSGARLLGVALVRGGGPVGRIIRLGWVLGRRTRGEWWLLRIVRLRGQKWIFLHNL